MRFLFGLSLLLFHTMLCSQEPFSCDKIPGRIRENANAVIRLQSIGYHVKTAGRAAKEERLIVTILNEKGENMFSSFVVFYDRFSKIKKLDATVYDASGKKMERLKKSNISDESNFDPAYQVSDQRKKTVSFDRKKHTYPYTIEFYSEEDIHTGMFYPEWRPVMYEQVGIEKTEFTMVMPADMTFRYKEQNLPETAKPVTTGNETVYTWRIENKEPFEFEDYMSFAELPAVYTAPDRFEVGEYSGNASSWKGIGKFYFELNKGRGELSEASTGRIEKLIMSEKDTLKIIQALYSFMQSGKRYVSIQLGIGGWQSMTAADVEQKGYGDCKALSNYMVALLRQAHIRALPVLVMAGKGAYSQDDFPSFRFNHCIVCVPGAKDSLWLECTSQENPMGYLGSFTGNRKGLLITEEGGVLVNTTGYSAHDNVQQRKTIVNVQENGAAEVMVNTVYKGIRQEKIDRLYSDADRQRQEKLVSDRFSGNNLKLKSFSFQKKAFILPEIHEQIQLSSNRLLLPNGAHITLVPNLFPDDLYQPDATGKRSFSVYLNPNNFNYSVSDTVVYHFAREMKPLSLPEPVHIQNDFGDYAVKIIFKDGNQLLYCRSLTMRSGKYAGAKYAEWLDFIKQINRNDKLKLVFAPK